MAGQIELLNPVAAEPNVTDESRATPLDTLGGKTIGVSILWPAFQTFTNYLAPLLKERYEVKAIPLLHECGEGKPQGATSMDPGMMGVRNSVSDSGAHAKRRDEALALLESFAKKVDGAIVGLGG